MFIVEGIIEGIYAKQRRDGKGSTCRIGVTTISLRGNVQNEFGFAFDLVPVNPTGDPHDAQSFATKNGTQHVKVGDRVRIEAYHSDKYGPVFSDSKDNEVSARLEVLAPATDERLEEAVQMAEAAA
jgi:hypothetical protein